MAYKRLAMPAVDSTVYINNCKRVCQFMDPPLSNSEPDTLCFKYYTVVFVHIKLFNLVLIPGDGYGSKIKQELVSISNLSLDLDFHHRLSVIGDTKIYNCR